MKIEQLKAEVNILIKRLGGNDKALALINEKCFNFGPSMRTLSRIKVGDVSHGKYKLPFLYFILKGIQDEKNDINHVPNTI